MKLRTHYILVIVAVGFVPLLVTAWLALRAGHRTVQHEATENLLLVNRLIGEQIGQYATNVAERLRGRSTYPEFADFAVDPLSSQRLKVMDLLERVHNIDPVNISSAALFNMRGIKLLDTDANQAQVDESQSLWIRETLRSESGILVPSTREGERPILWVTAPVRNQDGLLVGITRVRLQLAVLQQIVQRASSDLAIYAVVLDSRGTILAHGQDPVRVGTHFPIQLPPAAFQPELLPGRLQPNEKDEAVLCAQLGLKNVPWVVAVFQPVTNHESSARQLTHVTVVMMGVALIVSAVAGLLAANWLTRPIADIVSVAKRVAEGDFSAKAEERGPIEVKALAFAFNRMTGHLRDSLEELERRVVETEMSERRTREIVAAAPIAIAVADQSGELNQLNQAFVSLYGYTLAEIHNLHDFWTRAFPDEQARVQVVQAFDQRLNETRRVEASVEGFEMEAMTRDGLKKTVEIKVRALGPMIIFASLDLTARREAELEVLRLNAELELRVAARTLALSNANAELESFSYAVSHDLRSPLRAIDGFSRALEEDYGDKFDPEGRDYLRRIKTATRRMGMLIDDLLKLSRVSRGELKKEPVELSDRAIELFEEIRSHEPERKVTFLCAPHVVAEGDRNLIRIAMENLLHNAWKYSRRQPNAVIEFGVTERVEQEGRVERVFFVKDNGAGFDMRYASKLFGAFQRLHNPEEFEGTGVGLATVRRVVSRHGGRIWAEAEVNRGATFYFTLEEPRGSRTQATHHPFPVSPIPHVPRQDTAG